MTPTNAYFSLVTGMFRKLFGFGPSLNGPQGTAVATVSTNFISIGNVLNEGKVDPILGQDAIEACYTAQLKVNNAIAHGWEAGKGQY